MSWNGATEVQNWRIYGRGGCDGDWTLIEEVEKTGFETNFTAPSYQEFGMVEAVAEDGTGIRNSTNRGVKAFVPSPALSLSCTGESCQVVQEYGEITDLEVIVETRSACAALPVETTEQSAESENASPRTGPVMLSMVSIGLVSTFLMMAML